MNVNRAKIKLAAMDLDGTLTQHKSKLGAPCRNVLERLGERYKLLMVCAGSCERVYRQMDGFPADIIGLYGMQRSTVIDGKFQLEKNFTVPPDKRSVIEKIELLRAELGYAAYWGDTVEFHDTGLVTFPMLGTAAPLAEKLACDPDRLKRRAVYKRVCEVFEGCTVFIGGSSSFDIAPPPFCKLFALEEYIREQGLGTDEVIYFGDDYGLGGNDEDIYNSGITFIPIDDYRRFPAVASTILLD